MYNFFMFWTLLPQCKRVNCILYCSQDYCHDAELLVTLLCRIHEFSQQPLLSTLQALEAWQLLDSRLVGKWQDVLVALAPPATTRYPTLTVIHS